MTEVFVRESQLPGEGAAVVDEANVQYWSKHARCLENPHITKALKFLRYGCILYVGDDNEYDQKGSFVCLPLNTETSVVDEDTGREFHKIPYPKNYNSTIYTIVKEGGRFVCNCQGWTSRERKGDGGRDGCSCSHVLSLFFAFKIKRFRRSKV
ncbi:hypothetical protein GOV10_04045 [Candidatus Woesearchaeota archaeon]|nr:hypothetical protein [Candidatus Woesearchaeota archaeon]